MNQNILFYANSSKFDLDKYVDNNRNNIDLIINGIKINLIEKLYLKKGENDVKFIIII